MIRWDKPGWHQQVNHDVWFIGKQGKEAYINLTWRASLQHQLRSPGLPSAAALTPTCPHCPPSMPSLTHHRRRKPLAWSYRSAKRWCLKQLLEAQWSKWKPSCPPHNWCRGKKNALRLDLSHSRKTGVSIHLTTTNMKFHFSLVAIFNSFVPLVGGKGPIQNEGYTHYLVQEGGHWKGENKDRS